jgi:hypothetical protein
MDFYNELWGPAYLLIRGQSPYDTAVLNPNLPAAWFPMAIGFFFPFGWLNETTALQAWFALSILLLCAMIYWAQEPVRKPVTSFVLAFLCFFFPPVLNHLFLGQISITVTTCFLFASMFTEKGKLWAAAFLVALAFSKPHLAVLPFLGMSLYQYRQSASTGVLFFWGRVAAASLTLCIPLFIAEPIWIPDAIESMFQNPIWSYPSLFVLYRRYFPGWEAGLWAFTFLILIGLNFWLWQKGSPRAAMAGSLALAPLASPYVGSWDFVILLPLLFFAFVHVGWKERIALIVGYILAWGGMALVQIQPSSDNHFFWWVPLWFVVLIGGILYWEKLKADDSMGTASMF